MKDKPCDCCEGLEALTLETVVNRPGLDTLNYRVGTHASFLETMKARLTTLRLEVCKAGEKHYIYPLQKLTTRQSSDPAIALLDAWATLADVLTFYQERIANEGYLRTATEYRSIRELARLVGYRLKPGVAASVYLAFSLEKGAQVEIPAGTRGQSIPGPGELPQSFETSELLQAREAWNEIRPRLLRPQLITSDNLEKISKVYFQGIATNLKPNDPLLFIFGDDDGEQKSRFVKSVEVLHAEQRTQVILQDTTGDSESSSEQTTCTDLINCLSKPPSTQLTNALQLRRNIKAVFAAKADVKPRMMTTFVPRLRNNLYNALTAARLTEPPTLKSIEPLRVKAALFGHNAPLKPVYDEQGRVVGHEEWILSQVQVEFSIELSSQQNDLLIKENYFTLPIEAALTMKRDTEEIQRDTLLLKESKIYRPSQISEPISIEVETKQPNQEITFIESIIESIKINVLGREIRLRGETRVISLEGDGVSIIITMIIVAIDGQNKHIDTGQTVTESIDGQILTMSFSPKGNSFYMNVEKKAVPVTEELRKVMILDAEYSQIIPGSWIMIKRSKDRVISTVVENETISVANYGITGKVSRLTLEKDWLDEDDLFLSALRDTTIYIQNEPTLSLAEEPIETEVKENTIELNGLYDGLESGRWIIVSGERTDIPGTSGVQDSELAMIASVTHEVNENLPGDTTHTTLKLATNLAYTYKRDTVTIYANVVKATHGETREEILGSGHGSQTFQSFNISQSPLTHVAAATPTGTETTLAVRVNEVRWHEADNLFTLGATDRRYITRTDEMNKTHILFGDGQHGARLPTGIENVKAVYRFGIGKSGNVAAKQISLLATKPLGVKAVSNPLPASGGADREQRDQARHNIPLAMMALDRLVSAQDYAYFARTFAGISKASATQLTNGQQQLIHVTIAGHEDIPIEPHSELYLNFCQALRQLGDPHQPFRVSIRKLKLLVISAQVRVLPDYQWKSVEPKIRKRLLETFSFERRELGQDALSSEAISAIQSVNGVAFVHLNTFNAADEDSVKLENNAVDESNDEANGSDNGKSEDKQLVESEVKPRIPVNLAQNSHQAAEIAYLSPDIKDTLILTELTA